MIDFVSIASLILAKPFEPFALTLVTNERLKIPTKEHISLPPLDEANRRPNVIVVYNVTSSLPRFLSLESIISIDHDHP
jgi:hypothetical protein